VMGHGVRSALITAILRALVEELTARAKDPGDLLAQINRDLRSILKGSGTPLFTTAFYLVADLSTGCAHFANAGHPRPLLLHAEGQTEPLHIASQRSNPALGLFDSFRYVTSSIQLKPNDRLIFFTDGVYDVECNGDLLAPEWLQENLEARRHLPMSAAFDEILNELRTISGGNFCDDLCLLGMEVKAAN
jgi:phosphoserine phosphatase RsbU/P